MMENTLQKTDRGTAGSGPDVLRYADHVSHEDDVIGKLARYTASVDGDTSMGELAKALEAQPDLLVVGVSDKGGAVIGIVVRRELFDMLGRQFGRELYMNRAVDSVMKSVPVFRRSQNIYSVAEEIAESLEHPLTRYFALMADDGRFAGIFSTRDMLIYLSAITKKDLALAKKVQERIVREEMHVSGDRFEISGASRMAKGVGGDFYTLRRYSDTDWFLALCDVSGKGMSASLLSAILGGITSSFDLHRGLGEYLQCVNEYVFSTFNTEKFITGAFIDFHDRNGMVTLYDAGHSHVFLFRRGRFRRLRSRKAGLPLGISIEGGPQPGMFRLEREDIVVIITDGIDDQTNAAGERYGIERLAEAVRHAHGEGIQEMNRALLRDVEMFRGGQPQNDDMTILALHWRG